MDLKSAFKSKITLVLNKAKDISATLSINSLRDYKGLKQMVLCDSRESNINISQATAFVGQKNLEWKRISYEFTRRTLPNFVEDDCSAESRRFVTNSYMKGLNASEFILHDFGDKEGLIDTACKTTETEYIKRRHIQSLIWWLSQYFIPVQIWKW